MHEALADLSSSYAVNFPFAYCVNYLVRPYDDMEIDLYNKDDMHWDDYKIPSVLNIKYAIANDKKQKNSTTITRSDICIRGMFLSKKIFELKEHIFALLEDLYNEYTWIINPNHVDHGDSIT